MLSMLCPIHCDTAGYGPDKPGDGVEERRFTGPVGAEQRDNSLPNPTWSDTSHSTWTLS